MNTRNRMSFSETWSDNLHWADELIDLANSRTYAYARAHITRGNDIIFRHARLFLELSTRDFNFTFQQAKSQLSNKLNM